MIFLTIVSFIMRLNIHSFVTLSRIVEFASDQPHHIFQGILTFLDDINSVK